jgi:hypothetical protein
MFVVVKLVAKNTAPLANSGGGIVGALGTEGSVEKAADGVGSVPLYILERSNVEKQHDEYVLYLTILILVSINSPHE